MKNVICIAAAASTFASAHAAVVASTQESATTGALSTMTWAGRIKNNDLINSGTTTLGTGHTFGSVNASFPVSGINNGTAASQPSASGNTWIQGGAGGVNHFTSPGGTWVATFNLNTTLNTLGYDITSIESFMGWGNNGSQIQGNQTYSVAVSLVGSVAFTDIATVNYTPFATDTAGANYNSHVILTENTTGILASGVDSIRFTFLNPYASVTDNAAQGFDGTLIQELDVIGVATVPEPGSLACAALAGVLLLRRRRD